MVLDLDSDQRAQLELLSVHSGKPPAQLLLETARYLLENDVELWEQVQRGRAPIGCQDVLEPEKLDQRFATMLRR
jgi:hypothetical protein